MNFCSSSYFNFALKTVNLNDTSETLLDYEPFSSESEFEDLNTGCEQITGPATSQIYTLLGHFTAFFCILTVTVYSHLTQDNLPYAGY